MMDFVKEQTGAFNALCEFKEQHSLRTYEFRYYLLQVLRCKKLESRRAVTGGSRAVNDENVAHGESRPESRTWAQRCGPVVGFNSWIGAGVRCRGIDKTAGSQLSQLH